MKKNILYLAIFTLLVTSCQEEEAVVPAVKEKAFTIAAPTSSNHLTIGQLPPTFDCGKFTYWDGSIFPRTFTVMSDYSDHSSVLYVADQDGNAYEAYGTFDVDTRFAMFFFSAEVDQYPSHMFSGILDPMYVY